MIKAIQLELKRLLGKDLERSVQRLGELMDPDSSFFDEFILQESKLNQVNYDFRIEIISPQDRDLTLNKLRNNYLQLINKLNDIDIIDTENIDNDQKAPNPVVVPNNLVRGDFKGEIVDASFHLGVTERELHSNLLDALAKGERIPEEILYWDRETATRWIEYEKRTVKRTRAIQRITHQLNKITHDLPFDFISLGPGSGLKDKYILNLLCNNKAVNWYYPIDLSYSMLENTLKLITRSISNEYLKIKGIRADFRSLFSLRYIFQYTNQLNIFSILGNTLGNYEEKELLSNIKNAMYENDLLIIEVNIITDQLKAIEHNSTISTGKYQNELYQSFIKGPIENKGFSKSNGHLEFTINKEIVDIPSSIRVIAEYIIDDPINGRKTGSKIKITHSTHYEPNELKQYIINIGLDSIFDYTDENNYIGIFKKR